MMILDSGFFGPPCRYRCIDRWPAKMMMLSKEDLVHQRGEVW